MYKRNFCFARFVPDNKSVCLFIEPGSFYYSSNSFIFEKTILCKRLTILESL